MKTQISLTLARITFLHSFIHNQYTHIRHIYLKLTNEKKKISHYFILNSRYLFNNFYF